MAYYILIHNLLTCINMFLFFLFSDQVDEVDPEFVKKIKALDVDKSVQDEMIRNASSRNKQLQSQINNLRDMLARRKDRKRPVKLSDEEQQGLSREEQSRLMEARDLQTESDRKREDQALIDARRLIEKVAPFCQIIL